MMTDDQIEEIARTILAQGYKHRDLERRFARAIEAIVRADEREACAQIADEAGPYTAADLIRARAGRQHITDGGPCWCNPETTYTDPDTGASVIVHRDPQ